MSNETQTTETTADERTADLTAMMQAAAAAQDGSPKTVLPVIGPITDDGVIVVSDAPYDPDTTYVMAIDPATPEAEPVAAPAEPEAPVTEREKVWNINLQAWV